MNDRQAAVSSSAETSSRIIAIASLFGLRSHGLIFGFLGLGSTFGAAVGPLLTGFLYDLTGSYDWALLMCAAASLISLVFAFFVRSEVAPPVLNGEIQQA